VDDDAIREAVRRLLALGIEPWRLAQSLGLDLRQFRGWLVTPEWDLPISSLRGFHRYVRHLHRVIENLLIALHEARSRQT
jgi:hypothetical protein